MGLIDLVALGVGGMIGGGIFSILGLAVETSGAATPLAFFIGAIIAGLAANSYARLANRVRDGGASYSFIKEIFPRAPLASVTVGWVVVCGYIGTLALYSFTFGTYTADALGYSGVPAVRIPLTLCVMGFFVLINQREAKSAGDLEASIVYFKIVLLIVLAALGAQAYDQTVIEAAPTGDLLSVVLSAALIFVAFEGFQLITNAYREARFPLRNIPLAMFLSISITACIYIGLAAVSLGVIPYDQIIASEEHALSQLTGGPTSQGGSILLTLAAVLATTSAINATLFGASRMAAKIASDFAMPRYLTNTNGTGAPWAAVVTIGGLAALFGSIGSLSLIASFSSLTFLLVSLAVVTTDFRLSAINGDRFILPLAAAVVLALTSLLLIAYLIHRGGYDLIFSISLYVFIFIAALVYGKSSPHFGQRHNE